MKKHYAPSIPPRTIVLTWRDGWIVCGFARQGSRPVIEQKHTWLEALEFGSNHAASVGCLFFISDTAMDRILEEG